MLNEIHSKSPVAYQRYHVDLLLEDWNSALQNIAELVDNEDKFNECLTHIQKHKLFSSAYLIFCDRPQFKVCFFIISF